MNPPESRQPIAASRDSANEPSGLAVHAERREARVLAMQALCCLDAQGEDGLTAIDLFFTEAEATLGSRVRARRIFDAARMRHVATDAALKAAVKEWDVARMSPVDRNLIRAAEAELSLDDTPPRVVINEAIEIAREYGTAESPAFVNGVLDGLYKSMERG